MSVKYDNEYITILTDKKVNKQPCIVRFVDTNANGVKGQFIEITPYANNAKRRYYRWISEVHKRYVMSKEEDYIMLGRFNNWKDHGSGRIKTPIEQPYTESVHAKILIYMGPINDSFFTSGEEYTVNIFVKLTKFDIDPKKCEWLITVSNCFTMDHISYRGTRYGDSNVLDKAFKNWQYGQYDNYYGQFGSFMESIYQKRAEDEKAKTINNTPVYDPNTLGIVFITGSMLYKKSIMKYARIMIESSICALTPVYYKYKKYQTDAVDNVAYSFDLVTKANMSNLVVIVGDYIDKPTQIVIDHCEANDIDLLYLNENLSRADDIDDKCVKKFVSN